MKNLAEAEGLVYESTVSIDHSVSSLGERQCSSFNSDYLSSIFPCFFWGAGRRVLPQETSKAVVLEKTPLGFALALRIGDLTTPLGRTGKNACGMKVKSALPTDPFVSTPDLKHAIFHTMSALRTCITAKQALGSNASISALKTVQNDVRASDFVSQMKLMTLKAPSTPSPRTLHHKFRALKNGSLEEYPPLRRLHDDPRSVSSIT